MALARLIPTTKAHAHMMQYQARDEDRAEFMASSGSTPFEAIMEGIKRGDFTFTGLADDRLVCIFGVAPVGLIGKVGCPWLISSRNMDEYGLTFLRQCKERMDGLFDAYDLLINYVDARYTQSIAWLRWLGFRVEDKPVPYGIMGKPFHKFTRVKNDV